MADGLIIDPDDLDIGDLEDFEEITGQAWTEAFVTDDEGNVVSVGAKAMKALVYIVMRRENPDFTLEDARKLKVSSISLGSDPTPAASAKSRPKR